MQRYCPFLTVVIVTLLISAFSLIHSGWHWSLYLLIPLSLLGCWDLLQTRHTLLRNYPILGHLRWLFEYFRPYIRQYLFEGNLTEQPFNREQRSLVYERAKDSIDSKPLGTDFDLYDEQYQLMTHSIIARNIDDTDFRVEVGGPQCSRPYRSSLLNISAMSFGALSSKAIEALNRGARQGGFYHDTGEGGISPYHRHGGDLVWEIGTGYFGCRDPQGHFDIKKFSDQAQDDQVKMIEIKLSQGAKPGHGGVLPGTKVTEEIARTRHIEAGKTCISPPSHSAFDTPIGMLEFANKLREHSGGKPVGIKLCVGQPWELFAICKAMLETGILLDYIVVDGGEGGTGAAPEEFSDHMGMALRDGLVMVRNALVGCNLRGDIRIAAAGKVYSAFSIARNMALGADWCNAARAFMFTLGCVMSKQCHTDHCPTGVATQNPNRQRGLVVEDKYLRVANFHRNTLQRLGELIGAAGLKHPGQLRPHHLYFRAGPNRVTTIDQITKFLSPGVLLDAPDSTHYAQWWHAATADSFKPLYETGPSSARKERQS